MAVDEKYMPIDIFSNLQKQMIKQYLQDNGMDVKGVVMDMNPNFKETV